MKRYYISPTIRGVCYIQKLHLCDASYNENKLDPEGNTIGQDGPNPSRWYDDDEED